MPSVVSASSGAPPQSRRHAGRALLLVASLSLASLGLLFWWIQALVPIASWQISLLLAGLLALNLAPFCVELAARTFDPFDPKYIFLGYFFLIFTFHSLCRITLGIGTNPALAALEPGDDLRVRALSAMLIGLAAFVSGCYLPVGRFLGHLTPKLPLLKRRRGHLAAWTGIGAGLLAFWLLMRSAGGIGAFLSNLGSWRTTGVLAGVGYLTFPITLVLPASCLLLLLQHLPVSPRRLTWTSAATLLLYGASLAPVFLLGFRGSLLPAILQFFAAWHYGRRRLSVVSIGLMAAGLLLLLSVLGLIRSAVEGETHQENALATAVIFRVPGLDTVERVVWRMDRGEPDRGLKPGLTEAATILVPRALWPGKPEPASLAFADIFFSDFFLGRGDPLDGVKSGVSPTLVAELLWIGGLPFVAFGALALGTLSTAINTWRQRAPHHPLHIFVAAIFMGWFAIFVEAPQNTLNTFVMFATFCLGLALILTLRLGRRIPAAISLVSVAPAAEGGATRQ